MLLLTACSTTSHLPEDDQLYIGLKDIEYEAYEDNTHFDETRLEIEAALATPPNGSLFGSSRFRLIPFGLLIWNATADAQSKFGQWVNRTFGKKPVLMSQVNPALRASVASSVLRKNGYMHGSVSYETLTQKNPKKAKIAYTVHLDSLFLIDSMAYVGFPPQMQQLIDSTVSESQLQRGTPFSVTNLDAERTRLSSLFRNNGYYYYEPSLASFFADTLQTPLRAQLRLQLADSLKPEILKPWYIGRMNMQLRRYTGERPDSTDTRRGLVIQFAGKHAPLKPSVIRRNMKMRPRQLFSYADYQESLEKINATNIFSSVDLRLTPREPDTLDQQLICTLDKPYDFYIEANFINRTIGRLGPELKIGFAKRNAFRGGERLDINLHGANEWQTSGGSKNTTYQYGADLSLEFPRTLVPQFTKRDNSRGRPTQGMPPRRRRRQFFSTPWTIAKVSSDVVRRPEYYKMHIVTGEWTYRWQVTETSRHEFSPLTVKYQFLNSHTELFDSLVNENPYIMTAMGDRFIPKIRYTYSYTSPKTMLNPIRWETTIEEAGNLTALYHVLVEGAGWQQKDKKLFKNVYSQFVRLETDFAKTWRLSTRSRLVGHLNAGVIVCYGNTETDDAPFSETFYAGGANSIRAFPVRSIGPGGFPGFGVRQFSYITQNGTLKFVGNLEWRFNLAGSLDGAIFLDAGNVWLLNDLSSSPSDFEDEDEDTAEFASFLINSLYQDAAFKPRTFFKQLATGTGFGLRYDLDFLVIRVDWGFGFHVPYDTEKSGYFNIPKFKDMHSLHLAVGYPF